MRLAAKDNARVVHARGHERASSKMPFQSSHSGLELTLPLLVSESAEISDFIFAILTCYFDASEFNILFTAK